MSKILLLGLVTSGIASIAAGEAEVRKQANQSRGDIGGFVIEGEARVLPQGGRFADDAEMRDWIASPARVTYRTLLTTS